MNVLDGHKLAEQRVQLANEFSTLSEELGDILTIKAARWAILRADPECKSDTAAERKWQNTPEGLREMRIRLKLKAYEKQIASLGTMLRTLELEARNTI